jgi:fluoroacetyl-CoA thioesterase
MKPSLKAGLKHRFAYMVPETKTVPHLYAEAPQLESHLDHGEGSLGTHIDISHKAATPPGFTVTVEAECVEMRGPRARFKIVAHDGVDEIGSGTHERFIVSWDRFNRGVTAKAAKAQAKGQTAEAK